MKNLINRVRMEDKNFRNIFLCKQGRNGCSVMFMYEDAYVPVGVREADTCDNCLILSLVKIKDDHWLATRSPIFVGIYNYTAKQMSYSYYKRVQLIDLVDLHEVKSNCKFNQCINPDHLYIITKEELKKQKLQAAKDAKLAKKKLKHLINA